MGLTLSEGKHTVEAQAVDGRGVGDPSPAIHTVTVDTTRPQASVEWRLRGGRVVYAARVTDASGVDASSTTWSFPDGSTATGPKVIRRATTTAPGDVTLTVRDRAGNETVVTTSRDQGLTPMHGVAASRKVSRRRGAIIVHGRLNRSARVIASLQPVSRTQASVAGGQSPRRVHAGSIRSYSSGAFAIRVPLRGVTPGAYRMVLSATGPNGLPLGASVVRRVRVTA